MYKRYINSIIIIIIIISEKRYVSMKLTENQLCALFNHVNYSSINFCLDSPKK